MANENTNTGEKIKGLEVRHAPDPAVSVEEYNMDAAFIALLMNEPFLGGVSMRIVKREDWKCDTAYVGFNPQSLELVMGYNPDFMRGLIYKHRLGVYQHELYHVVFKHILERASSNRKKARLWNVATDLAINSIIGADNLPDFCLMPGRAPKFCEDEKLRELIASFPLNEAADWYMEKLEEFADKNGNKDGEGNYTIEIGNGDGESLDGHGGWGDLPEELKDILSEKINEAISNGVQRAREQNQWGKLPSSLQAYIDRLFKREIDWKAVLRMFVGRCRSMERDSTLKRCNKKNIALGRWAFPGVKRLTHAKLLFAVDQSGSMSDENVQMGLAEGLQCSLEGEIDMVNFDYTIDEASLRTVKRGQNFKWERTRCGGTNFDCVREFAMSPKNRGKWQGIVVVTDGYAPQMGAMVGTRVLWLITPDGTMESVRPGDLVIQMKKEKQPKTKAA